jgi:hypothetical protein
MVRPPTIVALLVALSSLTSCASVPPPPANMAINYKATSGSLGYVVSLAFFTKAQMKSPLWEFARVQRATMNWCQSESRFRRRDVRWVAAKGSNSQQCAMVIYTVECLDPRAIADKVDPRFNDHLEQSRSEMLNARVPVPPDPDCGQKDRREISVQKKRSARHPKVRLTSIALESVRSTNHLFPTLTPTWSPPSARYDAQSAPAPPRPPR